jgi:hypothetical protein
MKGFLCAGLLVWLGSIAPAQAYESDIHYSATYVLARAVGWAPADALTIASANEGVDENQDTVAALEVDTIPGPSFHQADKNLRLHCFSNTPGRPGEISADVLRVLSARFAEVPVDEDARGNARRLIALGTALHCQQDAYSHLGFGGSCGSYAGSCSGHTYETFLDQVVFGLLGRHHFNPDHPGVAGQRLLPALQGTVSELSVRLPRASLRPVPASELVALSNALRGSGLELPDDVRRDCNRYVAGKWLHDFFLSGNENGADAIEKLAPQIAVTCKNASLASATVVRIPEARFPRLNADASPSLVRADGTYQLLRDGSFDTSLPRIANHRAHEVKVQLSHWTQILALPVMTRVAGADHQFSRTAYLPAAAPVPPL